MKHWPWACAAFAASCASPALEPARPPNVVVVLVDDLGWSDTSVAFGDAPCEARKAGLTPNIERLAREGTRFSRAYAAAPVCTPTRASLMTGLAPHHTGITYWTLHADQRTDAPGERLAPPEWNWAALSPEPGVPHAFAVERTLASTLRERGYRTIHAGKWHLGGVGSPGADPTRLGFDVNIAGCGIGAPGSHRGQDGYGALVERDHVWDVPGLERYHGSDVFLSDAITREALAEVRSASAAGQPFFLHLAHYAVHVPLDRDDRYYAALRERGYDDLEARYAALVAGVDASVGELLATLEELGELERTVVVFTSDNGGLAAHGRTPPLNVQNAPLRSGKGSAYDGGLRVPLIVRWPGAAGEGARCDAPVVTQDLFATLTALAGSPQRSDGVDLAPLLNRGELPLRSEPIVWHCPHYWGVRGPGIEPFSALLEGDWKLIWFHDGERLELYDVANDPGETRELSAQEPRRVERLRALLRAELAESRVGLPTVLATGAAVRAP